MASTTKVYKTRKHLKDRRAGAKRKNLLNKYGSTPTPAEFFGDVKTDKHGRAAAAS